MITDARVLRADFVPRNARHRHSEVDALTTVLDPLLDEDEYDYILFDLPGSRHKLTNNAVVVAPIAILRDRVRWGLEENAVCEEQLHWIADSAGGDARVAIGALRAAAQVADRRSLPSLTDGILQEAALEAKAEIRQQNIEKLNEDLRTLYNIISTCERIPLAELYEQYCVALETPKSQRMVGNYLQKM